mgnify:CR=1 FL=1
MIRPSLEVSPFLDKYGKFKIGILTNQSGLTASGVQNIDFLLSKGFNIEKIFIPEHGLRGDKGGGERMNDHTDPFYGVPVISLYDEKMMIDPEKLSGIDCFVYDIQDVGARFYTYISTLRSVMLTISGNGLSLPVVVLDRPAFLGSAHQGTLPGQLNFLAPEHIPVRYGMTPGEFALFVKEKNVMDIDLRVIKMEGYRKGMDYTESGLPFIPPSSAIKNFDTGFYYTGTCLLEGTSLSEGRGTATPFLIFGCPGMPPLPFSFEGIDWEFTEFTPAQSKHKNTLCKGIRIKEIDRMKAHPFRDTVRFLISLYREQPYDFLLPHFDNLAGGSFLREMIMSGNKEAFLTRLEKDENSFTFTSIY